MKGLPEILRASDGHWYLALVDEAILNGFKLDVHEILAEVFFVETFVESHEIPDAIKAIDAAREKLTTLREQLSSLRRPAPMEAIRVEKLHSGICDACGCATGSLRTVNAAPIAGASICHPSCPPKTEASPVCERNDALTSELLNMAGLDVSPQVIRDWTDEQCRAAEQWAGSRHLAASDHDDVVVPPKPEFLNGMKEVRSEPV